LKATILGDRYELIEKIDEGGMSIVYKAHCRILDRIVAVKILKEEYSRDKSFVEKFKSEAQSAARISHPNIVNIFDVGQENDVHYIVMEYVAGKTLKDLIREEAPLSVDKAVNIAIMICDGVNHAHEKGIIHRDIKPHNILITEHGMVKVADFGIARAMTNATITYGNNIVGSVHYISPEQAKGEIINRTADIYSIGCVLYEMLTGKVPFTAESPITIALKHIHDQPPSPRLINDEIPPALEGIIFKAMEKVPAHRFPTAEHMRNALLNLNGELVNTYPVKKAGHRSAAFPIEEGEDVMVKKRRKIKPAGVAIIAIAIVGLLSGIFFVMGGNLFGEEIPVPEVEGLTYMQAQELVKKQGLELNVYHQQYDDEVEKDVIISQDPRKGMKVKKGRQINVVVSLGSELVPVPNVTGISKQDAIIRLSDKGLNLVPAEERYDDKYDKGIIISQDPESGDKVESGTNVKVAISKGKQPEKVSMPDLKGLTVEKARQKLSDLKLLLGDNIKRQESTQYYANQISEQDTAPGVLVDEGTTINVTISTGPGPTQRTKTLEFKVPSSQPYYKVEIKVTDARGERNVYSELHRGGDTVSVGITYLGAGTADVYFDGEKYKTYSF
jgi:serine/threonine-protein kinase